MSNLQHRIEKIEAQTLGTPATGEMVDWRDSIRRRMRGECVPLETYDWRAGKTADEIVAIEAIARRIVEMEAAGATADEVIAEIERACD